MYLRSAAQAAAAVSGSRAAGRALEPLLLESARLSVAIRRTFLKVKRDPKARYYYTYVLLLQGGKFYVGASNNVYNRLLDHALLAESSALWVKEHGPVQRVVEILRDCAPDDERYKTLEYMSMFGWSNVRGASYCKPSLQSAPAALAEFRRDPHRPFQYLSRREIDDICAVVDDLADAERLPPTPPPDDDATAAAAEDAMADSDDDVPRRDDSTSGSASV